MTVATNPAANAVRHGLAGTRHVLPEHREFVKNIENEFVDIFRPESPDEQEILAEMALHKFRVGEIDRQQLVRDGLLKAKAGEIAEREAKEKFETLFKEFQKDPQNNIDAFKFNHLGAQFAASAWQSLAEAAAPDGGGVTIEIAWNTVLVEGRDPHILYTTGPGGWLMGRALAVAADPDEAIESWLEKSGARQSKTAASRARTFLQLSADAGVARKELHERAKEKMQFWREWAESRQAEFNAYKEKFAETVESGDPQLDRDTRLSHRYRTKSLNQFNSLQRRLDTQRSAKMKHYRWTQDYLARESQQKIANDIRISALSPAACARLADHKRMEFSEMRAMANNEHKSVNDSIPDVETEVRDFSPATDDISQENKTVEDEESLIEIRERKKAAREALEQLDGGRWLAELEQLKSASLNIKMFREWPDELMMVHPMALCNMIADQETHVERKADISANWLGEFALRLAKNQVAEQMRAEAGKLISQQINPDNPESRRERNRRLHSKGDPNLARQIRQKMK